MTINTITCHRAYNHGAMLQAYALIRYLQSLGHEAVDIHYWPEMGRNGVNYWWVPAHYRRLGYKQAYILNHLHYNYRLKKRKKAFDLFAEQFIPTTASSFRSIDELQKAPPEADVYIAGSDQIWNTTLTNGTDPAFYLDFGSPKRKISYAASFATTALKPGTEDFVTSKLRNFDAISVREESGIKLLSDLGYNGTLVVDPVFLLDVSSWETLINRNFSSERYIVVYDFEIKRGVIPPIAKKLARLLKCKIYSISPFHFWYANKSFDREGPQTFVSLIKHAQCVISNSFHGTAFAMIFGKDFFVVNRKDGLNIRMHDLLSRYNLTDRIITPDTGNDTLLTHIDYSKVYPNLQRDIRQSKQWLQDHIALV